MAAKVFGLLFFKRRTRRPGAASTRSHRLRTASLSTMSTQEANISTQSLTDNFLRFNKKMRSVRTCVESVNISKEAEEQTVLAELWKLRRGR